MALISVGGTTLTNVAGYTVEMYDISSEQTARNAAGTLRYVPIVAKYKVVVTTNYMTQSELTTFLSKITMTELSVTFYDPYTATNVTKTMYRGDRSISLQWDISGTTKLYQPFTINLIEL